MSSTPIPSEGHTILDQPWQIELYRLMVLKKYCELRASKNPFIQKRRALSSINKEFGWKARSFNEAAILLADLISAKEHEAGISR